VADLTTPPGRGRRQRRALCIVGACPCGWYSGRTHSPQVGRQAPTEQTETCQRCQPSWVAGHSCTLALQSQPEPGDNLHIKLRQADRVRMPVLVAPRPRRLCPAPSGCHWQWTTGNQVDLEVELLQLEVAPPTRRGRQVCLGRWWRRHWHGRRRPELAAGWAVLLVVRRRNLNLEPGQLHARRGPRQPGPGW
jgi:hypothetical protein